MRLTELSLNSRVTVFFLMVAVVFAGLTAYRTLPRESYPDIEIPLIIVYTIYPGAAPADVEKQVTDQLERELKGLLILSSAFGDCWGDSGLCRLHERMLMPEHTCDQWEG